MSYFLLSIHVNIFCLQKNKIMHLRFDFGVIHINIFIFIFLLFSKLTIDNLTIKLFILAQRKRVTECKRVWKTWFMLDFCYCSITKRNKEVLLLKQFSWLSNFLFKSTGKQIVGLSTGSILFFGVMMFLFRAFCNPSDLVYHKRTLSI